MTEHLKRFFQPRSVAVIEASSSANKAGNDVIKKIAANDYMWDIYLVNPKGGVIYGKKAYRSINDLPPGIDLAIIILPAKATAGAVRLCAEKGMKAVVIATGGFSEVNEDGKALEGELKQVIKETGLRALGPNTSGHTSTPHNFTSSFFPLGRIPKGPISYLAQTGNFATHTMRHIAIEENFGVARVVGLGMEPATPDEARKVLKIKGIDKVNF